MTRFISADDARSWIEQHDPDSSLESLSQRRGSLTNKRWNYEDQRARSLPLVRRLLKDVRFESALFWATEYGIWPSGEDWPLYARLRQSLGNTDELHVTPGHVFEHDERDVLVSFLDFAFRSGWGGVVRFSPASPRIDFDHDGNLFIGPQDTEAFRQLASEIDAFGLRVYTFPLN